MPVKGAPKKATKPKKVSTKAEIIKKAIQAFENKLDKKNWKRLQKRNWNKLQRQRKNWKSGISKGRPLLRNVFAPVASTMISRT